MATRIGIPRCLLYYMFFPGWKAFFEALGAEVVLSPKTNKQILDQGVKIAVDEICLPFKLFFGHVEALKEQADYIFVPRYMSISRNEWICPKFLGLPDMVKAQQPHLPPLIAPDLNMRRSSRALFDAALEAAKPLKASRWQVTNALYRGIKIQRRFEHQLRQGKTPPEILEGQDLPSPGANPLNILLLGHPYLIYESHTNMDLLKRLRTMGALVVTPEMLSPKTIREGAARQPKALFWTLNKQVMGAAYHYIEHGGIDGIVQLAAFGCGPDAFINELVERRLKHGKKVPLLAVNVDEHSGEAGMVTRLEAFMDMVKLRRKSG